MQLQLVHAYGGLSCNGPAKDASLEAFSAQGMLLGDHHTRYNNEGCASAHCLCIGLQLEGLLGQITTISSA